MSRVVPPTRGDFVRWRRIATRWADNDAYGHVNNTVYYQWFDSAVNAMLVDEGLLDIASGDPIALATGDGCVCAELGHFPAFDHSKGIAARDRFAKISLRLDHREDFHRFTGDGGFPDDELVDLGLGGAELHPFEDEQLFFLLVPGEFRQDLPPNRRDRGRFEG